MNKSEFGSLLFQTFTKWQKHDATLRAAALAFFTILPLPSLALIAMALLAQVYGQEQALQQLITQVTAFAGPSVGNLFSDLLRNAQSPLTSIFGSFVAIVFALAGAFGAFSVLQKSVDIIWEIKPVARGIKEYVKEKFFPFIAIIGLSAVVVAYTTVTTVLFGVVVYLLNPVLGGFTSIFLRALEIVLSLGLGTLLFAIIFKLLPETRVEWRDVWLAAFLTGVVFTLLNYFFGVYLGLVQVTTLAGTAGSLIVLFLWIYVTNLFLLFGVQFSKVYAQKFGSYKNKPIVPKKPSRPRVDRVEITSEINLKVTPEK